jgi:hypothetical protein
MSRSIVSAAYVAKRLAYPYWTARSLDAICNLAMAPRWRRAFSNRSPTRTSRYFFLAEKLMIEDGEVIAARGDADNASVFGGAYPGGGSTLGPAVTFGFVATETIAAGL